jgi:hypothetical protein
MTARGRLLSCLVTVVMALAGFVTAGALPAAAAPSAIQYVALGDSYAAGTAIQPCTQSGIGYPALIDLESRIEFTKNSLFTPRVLRLFIRQRLAIRPMPMPLRPSCQTDG